MISKNNSCSFMCVWKLGEKETKLFVDETYRHTRERERKYIKKSEEKERERVISFEFRFFLEKRNNSSSSDLSLNTLESELCMKKFVSLFDITGVNTLFVEKKTKKTNSNFVFSMT